MITEDLMQIQQEYALSINRTAMWYPNLANVLRNILAARVQYISDILQNLEAEAEMARGTRPTIIDQIQKVIEAWSAQIDDELNDIIRDWNNTKESLEGRYWT